MRTSFILLSAAVLLAACSNDAETTAPGSPVSTTVSKKTDFPPGPTATAKPSGPAVTTMPGTWKHLDGIGITLDASYATCPAGTLLVGGGFSATGAFIRMLESQPELFSPNTWRVLASSVGQGADFQAVARCLQL